MAWLSRGIKARRKRNIKRKENVGFLKIPMKRRAKNF